jgi:hypothetical protein
MYSIPVDETSSDTTTEEFIRLIRRRNGEFVIPAIGARIKG